MKESLLKAFVETGTFIRNYCSIESTDYPAWQEKFKSVIESSALINPWFSIDFTMNSLASVGGMLDEKKLGEWLAAYPSLRSKPVKPKRVGVISAGNIPLVGFHDFLCVILSGNHYLGKLSSRDNMLLPLLAEFAGERYPPLRKNYTFTDAALKDFDAIIATGSNNTFRYFEYYFRNYPRILRRNRNSIAVLSGEESRDELEKLGDDLFLYFGLGCRNVSKIYVPETYDLTRLFPDWKKYEYLADHNKYRNNYDYYKSIYLVNNEMHLDNGFVLLKQEREALASPVSVIYTEEYKSIDKLNDKLKVLKDQVQCIVSHIKEIKTAIPFGSAQFPGLDDYADGVDTMDFLISLNENR